ncbi:MAG: DUF302 domain-containing protein [Bacteroidetes bacterium]|nr:MAG: DUF302 domain-containing protein [Bacteroidota bacterium]MBL1145714.1 DUF302 domain-containing protein [Bacteroidota bacterium]MCB0802987.1 DUF302 domain-containing protein [Flavobacteriales bacterium]NOG58508.1 DUF302 domain-containing protein [Bacteroidota bacterium]
MNYYNSKSIAKTTIDAIRPKVEEALKNEGFGVLTEIDIKATMKKKLDKDYLPYIILGACNPNYADKVLSIEPNIGTMLPCNVILRELKSGDVEISIIDPSAAMGTIGNPELEIHAKEVQVKLMKVLNSI